MSAWGSQRGRGSFLFGVPSAEQVEHARIAQNRAIEAIVSAEGEDDDAMEDAEWVGKLVEVEEDMTQPMWWFEEEGCDGWETCGCGRSTLLDALCHIGQEGFEEAVAEHVNEMRKLYDHFWSGQGIIEGGSCEIGDACPACLTVGAPHVWDVYEAASDLAQELGEAVAAHHTRLQIGPARFGRD